MVTEKYSPDHGLRQIRVIDQALERNDGGRR
ncbi:hypothetical protein QF035_000087 [Streptomyces umbrinus]|uniref:Transposase n=1 Tax=Streptomyces umbrinus TaxID=67370 RepID=A0ABU0SG11_9ACTN|nr:hypothetical protein [Streptomyces umbrinus]